MKKGFTLSETLITIAVVGVIAAIIIPAMTKTMPSNNKVMFKKAYSTLGQTINLLSNDSVHYPSLMTAQNDDNSGYSETVERGFNYTCKTLSADGYTCASYYTGTPANKFVYLFADQLNISDSVTGSAGTTGTWSFTTSDGVVWTIYIPIADSTNGSTASGTPQTNNSYQFPMNLTLYTTKVLIDVNGFDPLNPNNPKTKGPNCTIDSTGNTYSFISNGSTYSFNYLNTCSDPDRFIFGIRYDGKIQVSGSGGSDSIAKTYLQAPTSFAKP